MFGCQHHESARSELHYCKTAHSLSDATRSGTVENSLTTDKGSVFPLAPKTMNVVMWRKVV